MLLIEVAPVLVQPVKSPVSNPPLTTPPVAELTTSVTFVLWLRVPLVPVIVIGKLPMSALLAVVTVSVDVPPPVTDVGLRAPDAPLWNPVAVRLTTPPKPFWAVTVTV